MGGRGYGGGEEGDYIPVTTRMTPALRWAVTRAVSNVSLIVRDKVTNKTVSTDYNFSKQIRTEVLLLTSLTP